MGDGEPKGYDIGRDREIVKGELLAISREVSAKVKTLYDNRGTYETDEEVATKMRERAELIAGLTERLRAVSGSEMFKTDLRDFGIASHDAQEALDSDSTLRIRVQGIDRGAEKGDKDDLEILIEALENRM